MSIDCPVTLRNTAVHCDDTSRRVDYLRESLGPIVNGRSFGHFLAFDLHVTLVTVLTEHQR